jgi:hypothetical protein
LIGSFIVAGVSVLGFASLEASVVEVVGVLVAEVVGATAFDPDVEATHPPTFGVVESDADGVEELFVFPPYLVTARVQVAGVVGAGVGVAGGVVAGVAGVEPSAGGVGVAESPVVVVGVVAVGGVFESVAAAVSPSSYGFVLDELVVDSIHIEGYKKHLSGYSSLKKKGTNTSPIVSNASENDLGVFNVVTQSFNN